MIFLMALIGLTIFSFGLAYSYESEGYLRAVELHYKFTNGFFADPESDYSKFLESQGGSTMIRGSDNGD